MSHPAPLAQQQKATGEPATGNPLPVALVATGRAVNTTTRATSARLSPSPAAFLRVDRTATLGV